MQSLQRSSDIRHYNWQWSELFTIVIFQKLLYLANLVLSRRIVRIARRILLRSALLELGRAALIQHGQFLVVLKFCLRLAFRAGERVVVVELLHHVVPVLILHC